MILGIFTSQTLRHNFGQVDYKQFSEVTASIYIGFLNIREGLISYFGQDVIFRCLFSIYY